MTILKNFFSKNAMLVILLFTMLFFQVVLNVSDKGSMFTPANINNLVAQNSYVVILATGMLLCILTGGNIDLSVGSIIILVGAFAGIFIVNWGIPIPIAIIMCLALSILIGAWQAFWIAYMGIPPFITTLSGMLAFRGLALVLLNSQSISPFPEVFKAPFNNFIPSSWMGEKNNLSPEALASYGNTVLTISIVIAVVVCAIMIGLEIYSRINKQRKGYEVSGIVGTIIRMVVVAFAIMFVFVSLGQHNGVPVILILLGVVVLAYTYFTQSTTYGRYLYAMGGNAKAARLSGVNTKRMMFFAYTNMGFLAGVAALVCVARFNQASTQAGTGYEMDAIASCFIGGASAYGGVGKVSGAVIGAIFMGVLNMGMSLAGWDQNIQRVIKGLVLLGAVIFDVLSKNRAQAS